jgi:hypothetical protein
LPPRLVNKNLHEEVGPPACKQIFKEIKNLKQKATGPWRIDQTGGKQDIFRCEEQDDEPRKKHDRPLCRVISCYRFCRGCRRHVVTGFSSPEENIG